MNNVLKIRSIENEERKGWAMTCPQCKGDVMYTVLKIESGEDVYLYCDQCSSFTLRDEDRVSNQASVDEQKEILLLDKLRCIYERLEKELPKCDCGGHFRLWSNVKCPHCSYEFPYNNGIQDEEVRYLEQTIVWVRKAIAYRGRSKPSNRLAEVIAS